MYASAVTGAVAVIAANIALRPIAEFSIRGTARSMSRLSLELGMAGLSGKILAEQD
jgi:hypothetical protein